MYHIFICDDEEKFAKILGKRVEECLKELGQSYEIRIFCNGIEMFQAMQERHRKYCYWILICRKSQGWNWQNRFLAVILIQMLYL